ncbi:plexin-C1-like protein [Lates japonicus]|uniref:Plexin-C1-like protein n=1 Tax=Lates japonicus TaxID=270547 RepID=A0AAD3N361_LATJO|nr:plexin-C1-like protein [Lates japonicus]
MILLPGLLFILWGEAARCLGEDGGFTFDGDLRHFAVATNTVYIATEEKLYQLNHDLTLVQSLTLRGIFKGGNQQPDDVSFYRVSETASWNATFRVNVLLPFVENDTLISCGVIDKECGYCEVLDLMNISNLLHRSIQTLKPKAVLFKQNYMTSVLAVRQKAWMVFFIGTGDGQLIKMKRVTSKWCMTHLTVVRAKTVQIRLSVLCKSSELWQECPPLFPQCTCILSDSRLPAGGLDVSVRIRVGKTHLLEQLTLTNCSDIRGPPSSVLCQQCIRAGCGWSKNSCSWANQGVINDSVCQTMESGMNFSRPVISSITPSVVSFYGRNHAVLSGQNLRDVTRVRMTADADCTPRESPVWNNTGMVVAMATLISPTGHHHPAPKIVPSSSWAQWEEEDHTHGLSPGLGGGGHTQPRPTEGQTSRKQQLSDPEFTGFSPTRIGDDVRITIENTSSAEFQHLMIMYGEKMVRLQPPSSSQVLLILCILLIPCVIVVLVIICRWLKKRR